MPLPVSPLIYRVIVRWCWHSRRHPIDIGLLNAILLLKSSSRKTRGGYTLISCMNLDTFEPFRTDVERHVVLSLHVLSPATVFFSAHENV